LSLAILLVKNKSKIRGTEIAFRGLGNKKGKRGKRGEKTGNKVKYPANSSWPFRIEWRFPRCLTQGEGRTLAKQQQLREKI